MKMHYSKLMSYVHYLGHFCAMQRTSCSESDLETQPESFQLPTDLQLLTKPAGNPPVECPFIPLYCSIGYLPHVQMLTKQIPHLVCNIDWLCFHLLCLLCLKFSGLVSAIYQVYQVFRIAWQQQYVKTDLKARRRPHLQPSRAPALCSFTMARSPATVKTAWAQRGAAAPLLQTVAKLSLSPQRTDISCKEHRYGFSQNLKLDINRFIVSKLSNFHKIRVCITLAYIIM